MGNLIAAIRDRGAALASSLRQMMRDDRGDVPIGTILVIALIVIPLLLLLLFYRDQVVTFFKEQWDRVMGKGQYSGPGG